MHSKSCNEMPSIISTFVLFFLLFSPVFPLKGSKDLQQETHISMSSDMSNKMKLINAHLRKINKPFVKSIKSADGDIIDCVLIYRQPAFDLPELEGTLLLDPPELPKRHDNVGVKSEIKQLWSSKGESCPNGTIPIRRTSANDILRSISASKFGKKSSTTNISNPNGHEHAVGYVIQEEFYGAKAVLNVWAPNVTGNDFSLSSIWVMTQVPTHDFNSISAGWHVYPNLNKDNIPRLFNSWTPDGYQSGCDNLQCPGFVQTNHKVSLGAAIDPISTYNGQQFDLAFLIWKDPRSGNWWLNVGSELMGYWPKSLFPDLRDHATLIEYGGEVYSQNSGKHTSTQMGSGHFPNEGLGRAAYARNLEVVYRDNYSYKVSNLHVISDKSSCYDVKKGYSDAWGNYIYFGGPGYNPNCP